MNEAGDQTSGGTGSRRPPGRVRRWVFRLVLATVVPVVLLGAIEAGLRLAGVGYSTWFFAPVPGRGSELMPNPRFGWRYFPHEIARRPEAFVIPAEKSPGTVRIFVLGSSAAQGFPDPAFGVARVLEVMLREGFPGTRFEVVNAAMVAINSHVNVAIARDCADAEGDLFVLYEGNNEVIGPWGPGTVFAGFSPNLTAIRAGQATKRLRLGQLAESLVRGGAADGGGGGGGGALAEWTGMELFLNSKVAADDPRLSRTAEHFRANVRDICRAAASRGKPMILCTVGVNLRDCPPFASLHRAGLAPADLAAWDAAFAAGTDAEASSRWEDALRRYERAAAIDDRHAELRFRTGRCLAGLGRVAEARAEFAAARDLDALRFRTDSVLNGVIREVAASERGVTLVDIERLMESPDLSAGGIAGSEMFLEHCHMTFAGNYAIARAVYEAAAARLPAGAPGGPGGDGRPSPPPPLPPLPPLPPPPPPPSLERCAELLGLSPLQRANAAGLIVALMERPPFTFQAGHESLLAAARREADALRLAATPEALRAWAPAYERSVAASPQDWVLRRQFAAVLAGMGDLAGAETQFRAVLDAMPFDTETGRELAAVLLRRGDAEAAIRQYRSILDSPWSNRRLRGETRFGMGVAEERRGRLDDAAAQYAEALREHPSDVRAMINLGLIRLRQQRAPDAERWFRAAVQAAPDLGSARLNLARALAAQNRVEDALGELNELVKRTPGDAGAWLAIGDAMSSLGRTAEAVTNYETAARLAPGAPETRAKLGAAYLAAGRVDSAVAELAEAARLKPDLPGVQQALRAARQRQAGGR